MPIEAFSALFHYQVILVLFIKNILLEQHFYSFFVKDWITGPDHQLTIQNNDCEHYVIAQYHEHFMKDRYSNVNIDHFASLIISISFTA